MYDKRACLFQFDLYKRYLLLSIPYFIASLTTSLFVKRTNGARRSTKIFLAHAFTSQKNLRTCTSRRDFLPCAGQISNRSGVLTMYTRPHRRAQGTANRLLRGHSRNGEDAINLLDVCHLSSLWQRKYLLHFHSFR